MKTKIIDNMQAFIAEVNEVLETDEDDFGFACDELLEQYKKLKEQFTLQPMDTAPTDGTDIWILTSDFGWVEGHWCAETEDFYKSQKGWASYDPENSMGTWVTNYGDSQRERRMYCGMTPTAWMPKLPTLRDFSDEQ